MTCTALPVLKDNATFHMNSSLAESDTHTARELQTDKYEEG